MALYSNKFGKGFPEKNKETLTSNDYYSTLAGVTVTLSLPMACSAFKAGHVMVDVRRSAQCYERPPQRTTNRYGQSAAFIAQLACGTLAIL